MPKKASKQQHTFEELINVITVTNFEIGSKFYAKPTYIIDPHEFYIIPFPFLCHLASISERGKPMTIEDLKENIVVIFTSKNPDVNRYFKIDLDENIRGVIQSVDDKGNCEIYALDRGFIEDNISLDRIFHPAHQEAIDIPSLIQRCQLDICAPIGPHFSTDAIEAFKFYIGNEKLSIVVKGKSLDKLRILVYNSNPDDIATLLALTHYTYLTCSVQNDVSDMALTFTCTARPRLTYQHMELNMGQTLMVRVQSGNSLNSFYVTSMSSYKVYLQNRADFTNYCKSLAEIEAESLVPGAVVGVKDDTDTFYERGLVLEVRSESKAKVKLVDWGSELIVSKFRVKEINSELFLVPPAHAIYCSAANDFVPWDNGLSNFLYKGYTLLITIEHVGSGFDIPHTVSLTQINI